MQSWGRPKDPDDIRFLGFDWSPWLTGDRTSISTSTVSVEEGTCTVDQSSINGGITKFRVQGGTAGEVCHIQNRVTFDNGESVDDTNRLRIREN